MYLLVFYFTIASSINAAFLGRYLGKNGTSLMSLFCMLLSVCVSLYIFYEVVLCNNICIINLYKWINLGFLKTDVEIIFDALASIMLLIITSISFSVHIYSIEYMYSDPHLQRFLSYLSLFTFFMLILVTAGNFLQLFIGWEGVGLCSYLLINFWSTRIAANKAAMKALIINKIGDVCLLLGIILFYKIYYTLDFLVMNCSTWLINREFYINSYNILWINIDYFSIILILIILGVCAKSAQIGLHTWLPDAMEGPTPVSALIHAATMVTAGVFLLLRVVNLLKYDENSLFLISFLGGITSFIAATIGLFQNDIKKIIAYSTCSQLGYMILSCGLNNYSGSLFHLMNHAFFKALLFLSAGAIIHSMLDQQDIRRMGMLLKYLPVSYIMILIGSLTIMGIPFLTGFYSKDFILEYAYLKDILINFFIYGLGIISAGITSMYSIKLLLLTFYNVNNSYFNILYNKENKRIIIEESKLLILTALIILFLGSVFIGFIFKDLFIGMGTDVWINTLDTESYKNNIKVIEVEFLSIWIKIIPLIITMTSGIFIYIYLKYYINIEYSIYIIKKTIKNKWLYNIVKKKKLLENKYIDESEDFKEEEFEKDVYIFWNLKTKKEENFKVEDYKKTIQFIKNKIQLIFEGYYFNEIYNYYLYKNKKVSYILWKDLDKGLIELLSHISIVNNIKGLLRFFSKKNTTRIDFIVFTIVIGVVSINLIILIKSLIIDYRLLCLIIILIILEIKKKLK